MSNFAFPNTIYDQPKNLLAVLGSWWASNYAGRDQVESIVRGKAQIEQQSMIDLMELIQSISRFTVPIYHTDNWYPLYLRESERNNSEVAALQYDSGLKYDAGYRYDQTTDGPYHAFPVPDDLVSAPLLLNRFVDPTFSQSQDLDFVLTDRAISFREDPFDNPKVAIRSIYKDGVVVDREALLWVYRGEFDWNTIYEQFGYVFNLRMQSSRGYRDLMNAIYNAIVGGTGHADLTLALSAMTGVPLVREASETVEDIFSDSKNLVIVTDQSVYKFAANAAATVEIGDAVSRGQTLTDSLRIDELNLGKIPTGLKSLALGKGFLATCFYSDLIFEDRDVLLQVDEDDPSGFTKIRWDLGGFPLDVDQFFDELHTRGVAAASQPVDDCDGLQLIEHPAKDCGDVATKNRLGTLAHLLDQRPVRVGETKKKHLPKTINPLRFLIENVLRNNAFIVRIKSREVTTGVGLQHIKLLQKVIPPHTAMILVIEITDIKDSVTENSINERVSTYTGMEPTKDQVTNSVSDKRLVVRVVTGTYQ